MKKINLAIVGATGMVGRTFLAVLEEKKLAKHINKVYLYASEKSAGKKLKLFEKMRKIEVLCEKNVKNKKIDVAFFSAGEKIAKQYAPVFAEMGTIVIDNSSAFRMEEFVPLIVPEVNFERILTANFSAKKISKTETKNAQITTPQINTKNEKKYFAKLPKIKNAKRKEFAPERQKLHDGKLKTNVSFNKRVAAGQIIANPNCSTIQCMLPLRVLRDNYQIKKINFATYQAVSGSGVNGIRDLKNTQSGGAPQFYPHSIHNNALAHIGSFTESGYTSEELKMINETRKILDLNNVEINATCVRIPINYCHSVAIDVELSNDFDVTRVREQFAASENLIVMDDPANKYYPLASVAQGTDAVYVGRIRRDLTNPRVLHMFCVADNLRKGAASNAVQILEKLL